MSAEGVQFEIHVVGEATGKTWAGKFRAKERLSWRDRLRADQVRRDLIGTNPMGVDPDIAAAAKVLGDLAVRLTESPEWWGDPARQIGGVQLEDTNVLQDVYQKAVKIEETAIEQVQKAGEQAKEQLREIKANEAK